MQKIDMTPTWEGVLPILIASLQEGSPEGQGIAQDELRRALKELDRRNSMTLQERVEEVRSLLDDAFEDVAIDDYRDASSVLAALTFSEIGGPTAAAS